MKEYSSSLKEHGWHGFRRYSRIRVHPRDLCS